MSNFKKTILIDLDGVLNEYNGDFKSDYIPKIKDGALDFLKNLSLSYEIKLFTTRNKLLASKWIIENNLDGFVSDITNVKELSWLYIDDRCIRFNGNFDDLNYSIRNFKAWYRS